MFQVLNTDLLQGLTAHCVSEEDLGEDMLRILDLVRVSLYAQDLMAKGDKSLTELKTEFA